LIDAKGNDISTLMKKLKLSFSARYRKAEGLKSGRVWQYRYWDHIIRNQKDMDRHMDYIHYNPVKHRFVVDPFKYHYSSIHQYYKNGHYSNDWGMKESIEFEDGFGE
jgi:putative transposase